MFPVHQVAQVPAILAKESITNIDGFDRHFRFSRHLHDDVRVIGRWRFGGNPIHYLALFNFGFA